MSLINLLGRGFGVIYPDVAELSPVMAPVSPEATSTIGCRDPRQTDSYIVPASFGAVLRWTVKDTDGNPVALQDLGADPNTDISREWDRIALFHDPFQAKSLYVGLLEQDGTGLYVHLPPKLNQCPGIYEVEVHWAEEGATEADTRHYYNKSLVSIEDSIYNRAMTGSQSGPLTLSRIRTRLRDFAAMNDASGYPEYSLEEILAAMLEPVELFNEMPPHVATYSPQNFPFRQQWLDATVARLLMTSGIWMQRNHTQLQAEGITGDDRKNWGAMIQHASQLWADYQAFVRMEKQRINLGRGFGIV